MAGEHGQPPPFMRADTVPGLRRSVSRLRVGTVAAVVALACMTIFGNVFVRGMAAGAVLFAALFFGGFAMVVRRRVKRVGRPGLAAPPLPMSRWDYAMTAHDLEGAPLASSDFAGSVLVLNFWATWCGPCLREMPALEHLRQVTADLGVRFACITSEDAGTVRASLKKRPFSLPIYTMQGKAPDCFQTRAIPATFIVDRSGRIVLRHVGAAAWDDESVVTFVRGLAATPATAP